jgi:hypothetical protein
MQQSLFLDFYSTSSSAAKLTLNNVELKGTVSLNSSNSGALISGTAYGVLNGTTIKTCEISVTNLTLGGIKVVTSNGIKSSNYAPLLINKASSYASLTFDGVSTSDYQDSEKAATSLLGNVGSESAINIVLLFENIALDGRTSTSIFTRATLLESFSYSTSDSSSSGTYKFESSDTQITYGRELSNGVNGKGTTGRNPYNNDDEGQIWYFGAGKKVVEDSTNNVVANEGNGFFTNDYLRYVYVPEGGDNGTVAYKHELDINQTVINITSGCGTYDDPYIIDSDGQLETLGKFLSTGAIAGWEINVSYDIASKISTDGKTIDSSVSLITDNNKTDYKLISGSTWAVYDSKGNKLNYTLTSAQVRAYLRNAYYMVTNDINLESSFYGLGGSDSTTNVFSGVIVGKLDENTGKYPTIHVKTHTSTTHNYFGGLIAYSNGSVVKNLTIDYSGSNLVNDDEANSKTKSEASADALYDASDNASLTQVSIGLTATEPSQAREKQSFFGGVIGYVVGGDNIIDNVRVTGLDTLDLTIYGTDSKKDGTNANLTAVGGYVGLVGGNIDAGGGVIFRNIKASDASITGFSGFGTTGDFAEDSDYYYRNAYVGRVLDGYAISEGESLDNTDKNYKISKLESESDLLSVTVPSNSVATIQINSAQQLFVLSAIVNSGAGGKNSSNKFNTEAYDYGCTRIGDYNYVGEKITDEIKASSSYLSDKNDCNYLGGFSYNQAGKVAYLVDKYTASTASSSAVKYASYFSGGSYYYNIVFNVSCDMKSYGNGFRGIGSSYQNNNSDSILKRTIYLYNSVKGLNSDILITLSRNLKEYPEELGTSQNSGWWAQGIGLFTALNFGKNIDCTVSDFTICGNLQLDYNSDSYTGEAAAGGFAALSANGSKSSLVKFSKVDIKNLSVSGSKYSGGIVGAFGKTSRCYSDSFEKDVSSSMNKIAFEQCNYDNINIEGSYAAGGYVGSLRTSNTTVITGSCSYTNSSISWNYDAVYTMYKLTGNSDKTKSEGNAGAGGLIGSNYSSNCEINNNSTGNALQFSNVTVTGPKLSYNSDYGIGGIIGTMKGGELVANYVNASNLVVQADASSKIKGEFTNTNQYYTPSAGLITGFTNSNVTVNNSVIKSSQVLNAGILGGYVGMFNSSNELKLLNSELSDSLIYSIGAAGTYGSTSAGGLCGASLGKLTTDNVSLKDNAVVSDGKASIILGFATDSTGIAVNLQNITAKDCKAATTKSAEESSNGSYILGNNTYAGIRANSSLGTDFAAGSAGLIVGSVAECENSNSEMNCTTLNKLNMYNVLFNDCIVGCYVDADLSSDISSNEKLTDSSSGDSITDYLSDILKKFDESTIGLYDDFGTAISYSKLKSSDSSLSQLSDFTLGNLGKLIGCAEGVSTIKAVGLSIQGSYYPYYDNGYVSVNKKTGTTTVNPGMNSDGNFIIYADYTGASAQGTVNKIGSISADYYNYSEDVFSANTVNYSPYVVVNPFDRFLYKKSGDSADTYVAVTGDGANDAAIEAIINDLTASMNLSSDNENSEGSKTISNSSSNSDASSNNDDSGTVNASVSQLKTDNMRYNGVSEIAEKFATGGAYSSYLIGYIEGSESVSSNYNGINEFSDFRILLLDTTDSIEITNRVNAYISLLTNCDQSTTIGYDNIEVSSYKWDQGYFVLQDESTLIYNSEKQRLTVNGSKHDNQNDQFTLLDVRYVNPCNSSQYYHLYIPVVVKKVLDFNFSVNMLSGSSTYSSVYTSGNAVLTSYGDDVTARLSYNYTWTANEWNSYIASGANLLWNYDKQVKLDDTTTDSMQGDSSIRLTLVDVNRQGIGDTYFIGTGQNLSSGDILEFNNMSVSGSSSKFTSAPLCDLLNLSVNEAKDGAYKLLSDVTDEDGYPNEALLRIWNSENNSFDYYGLKTAKDAAGTTYYDITIVDDNGKAYQSNEKVTVSEVYYLIINFTEGEKVLTRLLSLGAEKISSTSSDAIPIKTVTESGSSTSKYYTIGDFFEITDTDITTASKNNSMIIESGANDYINVKASATVSVNSEQASIFEQYAKNTDCYFRFALSASDTGSFTEIDANLISVDKVTISDSNSQITLKADDYIVSQTGGIFYLTIKNHKASEFQNKTVNAEIQLNYENASGKIANQFPEREANDTTSGISFSLASSISYSLDTLDSSKMSKNSVEIGKVYYREAIQVVNLTYNSYSQSSTDGNTSQLGINEKELSTDLQRITSLGMFDATELSGLNLTDSNSEKYPAKLVCTLRLEKKTDKEDGTTAYEYVNINDYLKNITLCSDGNEIKDFEAITTSEASDSAKNKYIVTLTEKQRNRISDEQLEIDITFDVLTGTSLEALGAGVYSNYRVTLTAYLADSKGNAITEEVSDYFVYTNAQFYLGILGIQDLGN